MIRVVIIDDSMFVREVYSQALGADPEITVVGMAPDPYAGRDLIVREQPDVIVLDLELPRMDGLTFLRKLMKHNPIPTVVSSGLTEQGSDLALEALRAGAVDVVSKNSSDQPGRSATKVLIEKVKMASRAAVGASPLSGLATPSTSGQQYNFRSNRLVAIGASTGGTQALEAVISTLPVNFPPVLVVQHMPVKFTNQFANRLNGSCAIRVVEAQSGCSVEPGTVYISPGDEHMVITGKGDWKIGLRQGPAVNRHRPAVDVLFKSLAANCPKSVHAALLTGMGKDGAAGLLELKQAGARTICQDEATSVVFGMPKEAINLGAADEVLPLQKIGPALIDALKLSGENRAAA